MKQWRELFKAQTTLQKYVLRICSGLMLLSFAFSLWRYWGQLPLKFGMIIVESLIYFLIMYLIPRGIMIGGVRFLWAIWGKSEGEQVRAKLLQFLICGVMLYCGISAILVLRDGINLRTGELIAIGTGILEGVLIGGSEGIRYLREYSLIENHLE